MATVTALMPLEGRICVVKVMPGAPGGGYSAEDSSAARLKKRTKAGLTFMGALGTGTYSDPWRREDLTDRGVIELPEGAGAGLEQGGYLGGAGFNRGIGGEGELGHDGREGGAEGVRRRRWPQRGRGRGRPHRRS